MLTRQVGVALLRGTVVMGMALAIMGFRGSAEIGTTISGLAWQCLGCTSCTETDHKTLTTGSGFTVEGGGHPNSCLVNTCANEHDSCGQSRRDAESAVLAINKALPRVTPAELEVLVTRLGERVTVNAHRQALQVSGCAGEIVAHIPLTQAQAAELLN